VVVSLVNFTEFVVKKAVKAWLQIFGSQVHNGAEISLGAPRIERAKLATTEIAA
jgi:hypothetical protein